MIAGLPYQGRKVAVLGLARSGLVAAQALAASGAKVKAWDDLSGARNAAAAAGIPIEDLARDDAADWAALVMSPGIPLTVKPHPVAARAIERHVPVIGDIELLWQAHTGARFIGITGTNGKSTTTALIGHILEKAGRKVAVGGNLGVPVLSLPRLGADGSYVIEMSSYQLDLVDETRFSVAILLNLTPDHLDRHGDMAGYAAAKSRIFRHHGAGDIAIVGVDDDYCRAIATTLEQSGAHIVRLSVERPLQRGIWVADGILHDDMEEIMDLGPVPTLPGQHNWQNAAAAYAACRAIGVERTAIIAGIETYPGLPHRQELARRRGDVRFINDSKATNADATGKALGCYDHIHWIAGGVPKEGGITSLAPYFPRIAHAYLIGEAADAFAATLAGKVPVTMSGDLATALRDANAAATGSSVVLLSPACASFDQFTDYEARGDAFKRLVAELPA